MQDHVDVDGNTAREAGDEDVIQDRLDGSMIAR